FRRLGRISNDSITLLTFVAVIAIMVQVVSDRRRVASAAAIVALLAAPVTAQQRASYLVVGVVVACFAIAIFGSTWARRAKATMLEVGLFGMAAFGLAVAGVAVTASPGVLAPVTEAFGGEADATSARARVSLYSQAIDKIAEQPFIGAGVGTKVTRIVERGNREVGATAHNIVLDMLMRVGVFGFALFVLAIVGTIIIGTRAWRRSGDDVVAAMAFAANVIVLGVITKAMVEPALDRFRLSSALGLAVGVVLAAQRHVEADHHATFADDPANAAIARQRRRGAPARRPIR
ncbi:MAG: O-antigen ligase family protein, partial [Actinomycetota bacterium]